MKTLYLHVGHYKTGTSAIQKYCSDNVETLAANDLYYPPGARPSGNPTNHGDLSLTLAAKYNVAPPPWYQDKKNVDQVYAEFLADCRAAPQQSILVSSEEFIQLGLRKDSEAALADLRERLAEFDVRILLYIREPMSLLKSWYNEVNKGPLATRPFPVFFQNLNANFLSQNGIFNRFADVFGADKVIVRSYKHVGMAHIRDFLSGIGYSPLPEGDKWAVNEGQDIRLVELVRLAKKREYGYDEATLSRIDGIEKLRAKVAHINSDFDAVSKRSDVYLKSDLSLVNVFTYHWTLIDILLETRCINTVEASVLRDIAIKAEKNDLELATLLMQIAHEIYPNGSFIKKKLEDYQSRAKRAP